MVVAVKLNNGELVQKQQPVQQQRVTQVVLKIRIIALAHTILAARVIATH